MDENKKETIEKAEEFIEEVRRVIDNNYSTLKIASDRPNGGTAVDENVKLQNCVIARVYIQPNKYNDHIKKEKIRKYTEEIAAIASGRKATELTEMRRARESSDRKFHSMYGDTMSISEIGGTDKRGYPVFEIENKFPCFP